MSRKTIWIIVIVVALYFLYSKTTILNFLKSNAQIQVQKAESVAEITQEIQALVAQANAETDPVKKQELVLKIPALIQKLNDATKG